MKELQKNIKNSIVSFLETVSSTESQISYKNSVPFVHIPNELVCQWDDLFSPEYKWYKEMWTPSQFRILEEYDKNFNKLVERIGELDDVPEIFKNDEWTKIIEISAETMRLLNDDSH